jgi:hypothetical protein
MPTFGTAPTTAGNSSAGSANLVISGTDITGIDTSPEVAWDVVGGAIGGVVLAIVLIVLIVLLLRRRKNGNGGSSSSRSNHERNDTVMASMMHGSGAAVDAMRNVSFYSGLPVRPGETGADLANGSGGSTTEGGGAGAGGGGQNTNRSYGQVPDRLGRELQSARDGGSEYHDLSISSGDTYQPLPPQPQAASFGHAANGVAMPNAPAGVYAPAQFVENSI